MYLNSRWRPFVLCALRALRPCDPRKVDQHLLFLLYVCIMHIYVCCMYPRSLTLMHICMMYIFMILDPNVCIHDVCIHDAYIYDP